MVDMVRGGLNLLGKLVSWKDIVHHLSTSEKTEEATLLADAQKTEPMSYYWDSAKKPLGNQNQDSIDLFVNGKALKSVPHVKEELLKESSYNYLSIAAFNLPDQNNVPGLGVSEPPKVGTGISNSGRDAGVVAGIVVAVISGVLILAALIAVVLYRHYVHRNVTSMNFDNPVYRKTTEDQFALEKNGYAPGNKLYLSTVGEEAQEPLNTPGTNEFV